MDWSGEEAQTTRDVVVELRWSGDQLEFVSVSADWAAKAGRAGLLDQVEREYRRSAPAERDDALLDFCVVPLDQLGEYTVLLQECGRERSNVKRAPQEVRSAHLHSTWAGATLLSVEDPHGWIDTAARQSLAEELTEVLQRPQAAEPGPAAQRLQRFLKGWSNRG